MSDLIKNERFEKLILITTSEGLNTNGKVHIKYLGTFQKKTVPARKLYNFHTKEPVDVPEHGGIRFIPSESLRKDVY